MAKLSYNPIFTNVNKYDESGSSLGIQIASKLNQKNHQDYPLIDAIDIDWDGAWLMRMNTYINTSYDLIKIIDQSIDLENLDWLNQNMNTVLSDYVSYSNLATNLEDYQKKLIPGANMSIDTNNVITTYGFISEENADSKYTYSDTFLSFRQYVIDRMFDYQQDERYNNLDKIYKWIIALQNYQPISYDEINLSDPTKVYYIHKEDTDEFIRVNNEYIISHPSEQYFISKLINEDVTELLERIKVVEKTIGSSKYDEMSDTYTYTGILKDINDLFTNSRILNTNFGNLFLKVENLTEVANLSSTRSINAYNLAYDSILLSESTGVKVDNAIEVFSSAYDMAYNSTIAVGNKFSAAYYTPITEEDRERLIENPNYIDTYIFFQGDSEPTQVVFNKDSTAEFYKYVPEVKASGMYKMIDEVTYTANNALFNLNVVDNGGDYVNLSISPDKNDGTNKRTLTLSTVEGIVDIDTGLIEQEGLITTYSLKNTMTYHSHIYNIAGANDSVDGLIIGL